jgi:hypothetical protein
VPEKHGACHGDILAEHDGKKLAYCGGWHDAGDMSQQTLQTADVMYSLLEAACAVRETNMPLYARLLEEAEWGLDFILKCRFGDGYRASSAGIVHWSDGFIGTMDDRPARVQNDSFDNYLYAAYESFAASILPDSAFCEKLIAVAAEDFNFAEERFAEKGFDDFPIFWEHSYPTSESLHMAAKSFAASRLYALTGIETYAKKAAEAIEYVRSCQCTDAVLLTAKGIGNTSQLLNGGEKDSLFYLVQPFNGGEADETEKDRLNIPGNAGISGFFYRNMQKKVVQHANHQSRENLYIQAFAAVLETQPNHPRAGEWRESVRLYGAFLKTSMAFTAPYGMLPAGLYHINEADEENAESFNRQHLFAGPEAKTDYIKQLQSGVKINDEYYFKIFPVWFSFRGGSAIHLAAGKAAAVCARVLGDKALRGIALEQLYWTVGKNPFRQSLMYGEGSRYAEQAAFLPGTMTGQLPVGIQTQGNEDVPYWPQANNATYKEVWVTTAGKWLSVVAELYGW